MKVVITMVSFRQSLTLITILFLFSINATAQTYVSGYVSGVWGPGGNPYIVDSTITIPANQELQILPGVEINLTRSQDIIVHGKLTAVGNAEDSIYFHWSGCDTGSFERIFIDHSDTCRFSYCVVDTPVYPIRAYYSEAILIDNSFLHGFEQIHITNTDGIISDCFLKTHVRIYDFSNINIINNFFDTSPLFQGSDICLSFYSTGDIIDNKCSGGISAGDNYNGSIINNRMARLYLVFPSDSILVENNRIYQNQYSYSGEVRLRGCDRIAFRNNTLYYLEIDSYNNNSVYHIENNRIYQSITLRDTATHAEIDHNLIVDGVIVEDGASADLVNNTIVLFQTNVGIDAITLHGAGVLGDVRNNIILGSGYGGVGINGSGSGIVKYNCIFGFDAAIYNVQSANNNIFENPQLCGGNPFDYHLQANSPCIDAGDPLSPLDPDSTRCDMGAYYYDHNLDYPPVVTSDKSSIATTNTIFQYLATATDDYGPLTLSLSELPAWLTIVNRDWVSDTVLVSGLVPGNQDDFSFLVRAEDGLGQIDTQRVLVEVSDMHILSGELSGALSLENSPYLCVADIEVPANDTLTIEPGAKIYFRYYDNNIMKPDFKVYGVLNAQGTETDSIFFVSADSTPREMDWRGITFFNQEADTTKLSYCVIEHTLYGVSGDSINWISIDHCRFELNQISIDLDYSSGEIKNSLLSQTFGICGYGCPELSVQGNVFTDLGDNDGVEVQFSNLKATDNYFEGGCTAVEVNYYSYGEVYRNIILDSEKGIGTVNWSNADVHNNTIIGCSENAEAGIFYYNTDSASITNNIVIGYDFGLTAIRSGYLYIAYNNVWRNSIANYRRGPDGLGVLSTVNLNGDSCDMYYNISLNPQFVGGEPFDYHLASGSPCIDAGIDVGLPFLGRAPDIGAYEFNPNAVNPRESEVLPNTYCLYNNYPNPFNSTTVIEFDLPRAETVSLKIFNILGKAMEELWEDNLPPGRHKFAWSPQGQCSGIYFYKLTAGGFSEVKKMVLLR